MDQSGTMAPPVLKQLRSRARILVVDDDPSFRTMLRLALFDCGISRPREAQDVPSALRILEAGRIDLVLLDWWLGPVPGTELVQAIRRSEMGVPIIMLTSETRRSCVVRALRLGVTDYLVKPYAQEELVAKIDHALSGCWSGSEP